MIVRSRQAVELLSPCYKRARRRRRHDGGLDLQGLQVVLRQHAVETNEIETIISAMSPDVKWANASSWNSPIIGACW
ncbi:MAG: hypothetical protein ABI999_04715 [Acidobacteriota bacterium]